MLDGLFILLTLSTVMAIASFLAGSLPLSFALSQSRLQLISTIGMGVLVGTSLIVIIPEGVDTLYSASAPSHTHTHTKRAQQIPSIHSSHWYPNTLLQRDGPNSPFGDLPGPVLPDSVPIPADAASQDPPLTPTAPGEIGILDANLPSPSSSAPSASPSTTTITETIPPRTPHAWIGLSLILGFILMYTLDTLPLLAPTTSSSSRSSSGSHNIYSLSDLASSAPSSSSGAGTSRSFSTTLGLVIHAAADGIALGASHSSGSSTGLGFIIFMAIMIHKAPAAFGLTSVLLKQGLGKRAARAHLVVFSLAAPAGAVGTWVVVRMLGGGGGGGEEMETRWWTGVLLLFSGGTFL
ncbi:MAG: hypothetical protein Q9220_005939 [cf. Caloplaca sp. 1 TL-2023]